MAFYPQTDGQIERQNSIMEAYIRAFVNFEQDNWAEFLPMAEFAYNNVKNTSMGYTPFELNCGFYPPASYHKDVNLCSRSKSVNKLANELRKLMTVYKKNLKHAQKLQKQHQNRAIKPKSYTPDNKVSLNSKYIKTKRNQKLEAKFFESFWVLNLVSKQANKIELPKKWRIYDVFYLSPLKQDTTKKRQVDETTSRLEFENDGNSKEYELFNNFNTNLFVKKSSI